MKKKPNWWEQYDHVPRTSNVPTPKPVDDSNGNNTLDLPTSNPVPPTVVQKTFVMAVCAYVGDPTSGCLGKTVHEASLKLGEEFVSNYLKGGISNSFRLIIPILYSHSLALELLRLVATENIKAVWAELQNNLRKLQAINWPTAAEKARRLRIIRQDEETINKWKIEAREEANKGINWSHNWNGPGNSSHDFHPGPAYEQLKTISSLGWLNRRKY